MKNLTTLLLLLAINFCNAQFSVIVSSDVERKTIDRHELRMIFFGMDTKFIPAYTSDVDFYDHIKTTEGNFIDVWISRQLNNREEPIESYSSDDQTISFIETSRGSIGIVNTSSISESKRYKVLRLLTDSQ